jgi:hypothetical protein
MENALDILKSMARDSDRLSEAEREALLTAIGWGVYVRNEFKAERLHRPLDPSD